MEPRETTKPRRFQRFFQLSLRTFLILVTLASLWTAHLMRQSRQQQEAIAKVRELGGSIYLHWSRDYQRDAADNIVGSPIPPGHPWLRKLLGDEYFDRVAWVDLSNRRVTDADLAELSKLRDLEGLNLDGTEVTTDGLKTVSQMYWLRELTLGSQNLAGTPIPFGGMVYDRRGPVKGDGNAISRLSRLRHLESLQLIEVPLPPDRLSFLNAMPKLRCLNLWGCAVRNEDLPRISNLKQLARLNLNGTEVTDAGLVHLTNLEKLEELYLSGTHVTMTGISKLGSLKKLKRLELRATGVTSDDIAGLQSFLPASCTVYGVPEGISKVALRRKAREDAIFGKGATAAPLIHVG